VSHRQEFIEAFELLGAAFDRVVEQGFKRPVLVGGGAVEYYTGGAVVSGDFDVVSAADETLTRELVALGFRKEDRKGHLLRGLYHPGLEIGVEVVSGELFDGKSDESRVLEVALGKGGHVAVPPVEDLIADRMGQFCSIPEGDQDMLAQAILLFQLAGAVDETYLNSRILMETDNGYDLAYLKARFRDGSMTERSLTVTACVQSCKDCVVGSYSTMMG